MPTYRHTTGQTLVTVTAHRGCEASDAWTLVDDDALVGEAAESARPAGNASTAEWADYARTVGVEVDDDATRAEIIAAVDWY